MSAIMLYYVYIYVPIGVAWARYDSLTFDEYVSIILCWDSICSYRERIVGFCKMNHPSEIIEITGNEFIEAGN